LSHADAQILSDGEGDAFGTLVGSGINIDGDGRDDLGVGAPAADERGNAYLFLGTTPIGHLSGNAAKRAVGVYVPGASDIREFGSAVEIGGDFDEDDVPDVLVGAQGSGSLGEGSAFMSAGNASGTVVLTANGDGATLRLDGESPNDGVGSHVSFTGPIAVGAAEGLLIASSSLGAMGSDAGGAYLSWEIGL
jgi:hypothetical protein